MDPVTHGIIGLGISALSSQPVGLNPITIGAVLGAMSPDIDIVVKYWGDYKYLKHHRGPTHSIPSLLGLSLVITTGLFLIFRDYNFFNILLWTFLGSMSHTVFDGLNSYGVRPFMPFSKKKYLANVLMLYDPFLMVLSIALVFMPFMQEIKIIIAISAVIIYVLLRLISRDRVYRALLREYKLNVLTDKIHVLPDLMNFFKWDFIIRAEDYKVVGKINFINNKLDVIKELEHSNHRLIGEANSTELGIYFNDFTSSIVHTEVTEEDDKTVFRLIDLRYFLNNEFMHHATIEFDKEDEKPIKSVFHPYKLQKEILIEKENNKDQDKGKDTNENK